MPKPKPNKRNKRQRNQLQEIAKKFLAILSNWRLKLKLAM